MTQRRRKGLKAATGLAEGNVRTTISLAAVVWARADRMMQYKGFNGNFSAYVADLIRRDQAKDEKARIP
ncbi:MAG TPA: hypothetical protein VJA21_09675 [Verrucomicrobiae bacterium]